MSSQKETVPTTEELQAYSLGKLDVQRAAKVESYLAEHPELMSVLAETPDDEVVRPLRGAGVVPQPRARSVLLQLAVEAVLPVVGGCAGVLAGGAEGGLAGVVVGQAAEKGINFFGQRIVNRWKEWLKGKPRGVQAAAVTQLAELLPEVARGEAAAALQQQAPQASPADRRVAIDYLSAIPLSVHRSLLTDRQKGGMTLAPTFSLDDSLSLLQLLPADVPPYSVPCPLPQTDYRLEELIGTGGFGAVYRASVPSEQYLSRAIKFCLERSLLPALMQERANLESLMQAGGESWSPRLVRLYGYNLDHPTPFLVYEFVPGGELVRWLSTRQAREGRGLTATEVLELITQVAEALAFAHQHGLVHRDLKPANVLMAADGTIKLADFGIGGLVATHAIQVSRIGTVEANRLRPAEQASLFRGAGTPLYMSREQKEGAGPDPRHDVYSLGVMWYQLLVGDVTRELHPGWAEELIDEHAVPAAHVETIKQCVGLLRRRPENAQKVLETLRVLAAPPAIAAPAHSAVRAERPKRKAEAAADMVEAQRNRLLRAIVAVEGEPEPPQLVEIGCLLWLGYLTLPCTIGVILESFPYSLIWGVPGPILVIAYCVARHWLHRGKVRRNREDLIEAIAAATAGLSLPVIGFDRSSREALCKVGWSLLDEIENHYIRRSVSAQLRLAGSGDGNRKFKVFLDRKQIGEGSAKRGFVVPGQSDPESRKRDERGRFLAHVKREADLAVQLCRGTHYLELTPAEADSCGPLHNVWSSLFDVKQNGNCLVEVSGTEMENWTVVVFEQPQV
jgi:serine/threonine protein kinase